jgi:hypothetical protein
VDMGGYDDSVLFENLELIRTVQSVGGKIRWAPEVFVARDAPSARAFAGQRVRQAYDDFAQPFRLIGELSVAPLLVWATIRSRRLLGLGLLAVVLFAKRGRRQAGGAATFPRSASALAPLWVAERACCVWIAAAQRLFLGGIKYRGGRLRKAASPLSELRRSRASTAGGPRGLEERCPGLGA